MGLEELDINPDDAGMLAQLAWNITRPEGDPRWENTIQSHRDKLLTHAQDVLKTGTASTGFEREVKRIRDEVTKDQTAENERKFAARREEEVDITKRRQKATAEMSKHAATLSRINSGVSSHALHAEDAQAAAVIPALGREQGFDQTDAAAHETNPIGQKPSLKGEPGVSGASSQGSGAATSGEGGNPALDANSPIEPEGSAQAAAGTEAGATGESNGGDTESEASDSGKSSSKGDSKSSKSSSSSKSASKKGGK